jgi:hypothetical protein
MELGVWVFDFAQQDGKGGEKEGIPLSDLRRRQSARRWTKGFKGARTILVA